MEARDKTLAKRIEVSAQRILMAKLGTALAATKKVFGALILSAALVVALPERSRALVTDPVLFQTIAEALGAGAAVAPDVKVVAQFYDYVVNIVGRSARTLSHTRAISAVYEAELGAVMLENTAVRSAAIDFVRGIPAGNVTAARRYALSFVDDGVPLVVNAIGNNVPAGFTELALNAAYEATEQGGKAALTQIIQVEAQTGLTAAARSALGSFVSSVGRAFGSFLELLSTHTAQRLFGVYAIANFTQDQINEALFAFQDEMEAIGDAAEAEAFNNNLQLMLDSLEDGRTVLSPGVTLSDAVRQLRRNMNLGVSYFGNILMRVDDPGPPLDVPAGAFWEALEEIGLDPLPTPD